MGFGEEVSRERVLYRGGQLEKVVAFTRGRVESSPSWARVTRGGWFQQHGVEVSRKSVFEKEEFRYLVKHD